MAGLALKPLFGRLVPTIILFLAIYIGWCNLDPRYPWEARLFASIVPVLNGYLPPILFGHGRLGGKMTPPVPEDMVPMSRPEKELFATLNGSGDSMPMAGIGMCCRPTAYDDVCVERTIEWYLLLGGRHIDGAHLYLNNQPIGRGIYNAMAKGIERKEIFLTSKVYPSHFGYEATQRVVEEILEDVGLDYLDMVLMHAPKRLAPGPTPEECKGKSPKECRQETWRALSDLKAKGKIRNAGVSNFQIYQLEDILELYDNSTTTIAPISNNQIPYNPWAIDAYVETVEYCKEKKIQITAYNSLGGNFEGEKAKQLDFVIELSQKYGRSAQQIMLRWALQKGVAIIPGTGNPKYMAENLSVYEFELTDADVAHIDGFRKEIARQFITLTVDD